LAEAWLALFAGWHPTQNLSAHNSPALCFIAPAYGDRFLPSQEMEMSLGRLDRNGGHAQTHLPNPDSLLVDAIPADLCRVPEDKRGERRDKRPYDIWAIELQPNDEFVPVPDASVPFGR
jgi:hypothetical protein